MVKSLGNVLHGLVLNPINLPTYYMLSKTNYDKIMVSYSFEDEHWDNKKW